MRETKGRGGGEGREGNKAIILSHPVPSTGIQDQSQRSESEPKLRMNGKGDKPTVR